MKKISKGDLKAKMFEYFRELEGGGEEILVTDHGKPVIKITRLGIKRNLEEVFNSFQGKVKYSNENWFAPEEDDWEK